MKAAKIVFSIVASFVVFAGGCSALNLSGFSWAHFRWLSDQEMIQYAADWAPFGLPATYSTGMARS